MGYIKDIKIGSGTTNLIEPILYGTTNTAAGTQAKVVSISNFELVAGVIIAVKFTVTNTHATPQLNVNSTGAKLIKYRGGNLPSAATLTANRVYQFVYDGTNWELIGDLDTNTWRSISDAINSTSSDVSASSKAVKTAYDLAAGKVSKSGDDMTGDLGIIFGDTDKFIHFKYSTSSLINNSWRLGILGTGNDNANYFVIQSGGVNNSTDSTWNNVIRIGQQTYDVAFGGNVYPLVDNSKTLGISSNKWSNVYATTFTGNLTGNVNGTASKATGDADGNEIKTTYAKLTSPTFTGTPKSVTPSSSSDSKMIATKEYVDNAFAANDAMVFKGTIGASGATVTALPATHNVGWTYRVITVGEYANIQCEIGDLIICTTDGTSANDAHWTVAQTNIDGAVTGPTSSAANHFALFNDTTGKIIKDSGIAINTSGSATKWLTEKGTWTTPTAANVGAAPSNHTHYELATIGDKRNEDTTPNAYASRLIFQGVKYNSKIGQPYTDTYSYIVGLRGWANSNGGNSHELAFNTNGIYRRQGATTTWGNWFHLLDSNNYTDYAIAKTAGVTAVTWDSTNKKLTRTINGTAADVVTIGTIKTALGLVKGDVGLGSVDNTADADKTVKYANMLTGFSSRATSMTWGNQTGSVITCLSSSGGGGWGFRDNNPTSGKMSMTIDGTIYIKEGAVNIGDAVKSFSVSGKTVTYTTLWGNTGTFTTQDTDNDTKNTAGSTNSESKLYLIGATSQAANPTTNSYQYTYTNNGLLSALELGLNLNGIEKAHLEWNDTDQSIDFIFA